MIVEASKIEDHLAVARELADVAAGETLRHFRARDLPAADKGKGAFDPVTEADRAAERAMRAALHRLRPEDGILGEEEADLASRSGLTWVLDPIDGTRGFLTGTPTWGTLIALRDTRRVILGLIDQPFTGERFWGAGGRAWLEHRGTRIALRTRAARPLAEASLYTTFPEIGTDAEARAFRAVAERCRLVRFGLDCYAYALVALGQVDLVIEAGLKPYDIGAPIGVIEAAGGLVSDWEGAPALQGGRVLAAANPEIHEAARALLAHA